MNNNEFILVNLFPYREKQKALQIKKFSALMILFLVLGGVLVALGHLYLAFQMEIQEDRNKFIESENIKLDDKIKSIANLKEEIKVTLEKRKIVEALQTNRADGVNIINELANNLPDDTNLKSIVKKGDKIIVNGQTTSNNKVSHYMTALDESPVFTSPGLVEIKAIVLVKNEKGKVKEEIPMNEFTITVEKQKSEEELKRMAEEKESANKKQKKK